MRTALAEVAERSIDTPTENSWRVVLEDSGRGVAWVARESPDVVVRYHRALAAGFWRRLAASVIGALPIRGQL